MTPEQLKASILQYAIQGKLVEQREEEGTAEKLYQQIQEEKQKLIKEGKIKKEKKLPEITEDEIPFDIPESWKWVRLGTCGCFERGSGIKRNEIISEGFPCVRYGQLYSTYKTQFTEAVSFISEELFTKSHKAQKGDILMALTGENNYDIALAVAYEGNETIAIGGDMTRFYNHCMDPLYLTYVLNSNYAILCKSKLATGNIIVHISNDKLSSILIPLPPLAEQHRIVAKLEELMPFVDRYAASYEQLEQLNTKFPGDMKKSILQYAIQGKLVEQREEEGTAEELYKKITEIKANKVKLKEIKKEKPLKPINENDTPFDIPESWIWCNIQDIFFAHSAMRIHQADWKPEGIPFLRGRELVRLAKTGDPNAEIFITEEFYNELKNKGGVPKKDDILISAVGTLGKVYVVKGIKPFYYKDAYILCLDNYGVDPYFIKYLIESPYLQNYIYGNDAYGTTVAQLTLEKLKKMVIPLPPLAEQHRIVAKLEELLPYCDRLE